MAAHALQSRPDQTPAPASPGGASNAGRSWTTFAVVALVAAGCMTVCTALLYPGYVNGDSQWQLDQARSGKFNDWHPPLLTYLWRFVDRVVPGSGGMFLIFQLLFWTGLVAFVEATAGSLRKTVVVSVLFLFYLPLVIGFSQMGKDVAMLAALMACLGALAQAERRGWWPALAVAAVTMVLACGFRHNALFALVPIAVWTALIVRDRFAGPRLARLLSTRARLLGAGMALLLGVVAVQHLIVDGVVRPEKGYSSQAILTYDLSGIAVRSHESYFPRFMDGPKPLTVTDLQRLYNRYDVMPLLWRRTGVRGPSFVFAEREYKVLRAHWLAAILSEPGAYLHHRLDVFESVLGIGVANNWPYMLPPWQVVAHEHRTNARIKARLYRWVERSRNSLVFRGWPYLLACLLLMLLPLIPGVRASRAFWAVGASVLANQAPYFLLAPGANFRYSWWAVACLPLLPLTLALPRGWFGALLARRHTRRRPLTVTARPA
jgi:hypothetical protein